MTFQPMQRPVPVTLSRHGKLRWQRSQTFEFACALKLCGLVLSELEPIALGFPIAFTARSDRLFPVILLANGEGESFFVGPQGQWLAGYLPALLRSYPFRVLRDQDDRLVLHVDERSGLIVSGNEDGELFFDGKEPSQAIRNIQTFLEALEVGRQETAKACALLGELDLLVEWPMTVQEDGDDQSQSAPQAGLLHINKAALRDLDAESLHAMHQVGALRLAILQGLSERHLAVHRILADARKQRTLTAQQTDAILEHTDEKLEFIWDD